MPNEVSWGTDEGGYIHLRGTLERERGTNGLLTTFFCLSAHPMHVGAQITTITLKFLTLESFRLIHPIKMSDWNPSPV
ncbi:hypothetical protein N7516_009006 [Penicillium verrucosum]|uniref:uncharacterized protein n=1 Tax=Penicillium verrucosum TaxID=60171 RepID=UPI0025450D17|nr:uncharacterized protein N7516_009006 [Penicillium verrucosum]KAJ5927233.1 hypothetical protein N7516_009006 [Penicillium verrucosum]